LYITNRNRNFRDVVRHQLRTSGATVAIDVGASHGQYGEWLRSSGFRGRVLSFEPERSSYQVLQATAAVDGAWQAFNFGLGAISSAAELRVAGNLVSSSILPMTNLHEEVAEGSAVTSCQTIQIRSLDEVMADVRLDRDAVVHLKIDVQGYEGDVLAGARTMLLDPRLGSVEIELSTAPLYESQSDWLEVLRLLRNARFEMATLSGGLFDNRTRRMLQFDALLTRTD